VANRGEIAARVFRTCRRLGIETVAVHSEADAGLPYVRLADFAVLLPGNAPAETYLRADLLVEVARRAGADAVHPGYGFCSENAGFASAVIAAGLTWIGPTPSSIEQMGSKIAAKEIMRAAGVPVLEAPAQLTEADLPLLVKASAGGGGRGMRVVRELASLDAEIAAARAEAESAFGDGTVFVEPYVERGRHVEVQLVGTTVIGDRDCSIQRRHQKVVEEAPAPGLPEAVREALHSAARAAAEAIDYIGAGTVEFLYDPATTRFWFLEMNTRLQVEHPVTEEVYGVDLVEAQLAAALVPGVVSASEAPSPRSHSQPDGHAIEVRLYAEDPAAGYQPQSGVVTRFEIEDHPDIRVEATYETGSTITTFYDPMIAKVIAHGATREQAARTLAAVLRRARIHGLRTNREQLVAVLTSPRFLDAQLSTGFLDERTEGCAGDGSDARRSREHRSVCAAAAVAIAECRRRPGTPAAWRNVTSQSQRTTFRGHDGVETVVEWRGTRTGYVIEGLSVIAAARDEVTLEVDGVRTTYQVSVGGLPGEERCDVDSPHGHTALARVPRFVDPATQVAAGSLLAPMPGSVVAVHAALGDQVMAGQPLLVMEAMKMQHTITAPTAGVVTELVTSLGQQVEAGTVLAVVEEAP